MVRWYQGKKTKRFPKHLGPKRFLNSPADSPDDTRAQPVARRSGNVPPLIATEMASSDQGQPGLPYIGSRISLVSKSEIRYEGVLFTIDMVESTIALQNGKAWPG
jgi:hypothetical protein